MQCKGVTKDNILCSRETSENSEYCWQHKTKEEKEDTTFKTYTVLRSIGSGSYGDIYLLIGENKYMVLKKVKDFESFKNEVDALNILSDPKPNEGVVGIYGIRQNPNMIYLEYIEGANLSLFVASRKIFKSLATNDIIDYIIKKSLQSLSYIHSKNIVHRDIKMDNMIFGLNTFKFIDFGFAIQINPNFKTVGTPRYLSPELLDYYFISKNKKDMDINYSEILRKSDVYALGIVFYILLNDGKLPYDFTEEIEKFPNYIINLPQIISKSGTKYDSIINNMLTKNYKERPFVEEIQL